MTSATGEEQKIEQRSTEAKADKTETLNGELLLVWNVLAAELTAHNRRELGGTRESESESKRRWTQELQQIEKAAPTLIALQECTLDFLRFLASYDGGDSDSRVFPSKHAKQGFVKWFVSDLPIGGVNYDGLFVQRGFWTAPVESDSSSRADVWTSKSDGSATLWRTDRFDACEIHARMLDTRLAEDKPRLALRVMLKLSTKDSVQRLDLLNLHLEGSPKASALRVAQVCEALTQTAFLPSAREPLSSARASSSSSSSSSASASSDSASAAHLSTDDKSALAAPLLVVCGDFNEPDLSAIDKALASPQVALVRVACGATSIFGHASDKAAFGALSVTPIKMVQEAQSAETIPPYADDTWPSDHSLLTQALTLSVK